MEMANKNNFHRISCPSNYSNDWKPFFCKGSFTQGGCVGKAIELGDY